jgi:hypothetical protein
VSYTCLSLGAAMVTLGAGSLLLGFGMFDGHDGIALATGSLVLAIGVVIRLMERRFR